jgi:hypothetical protein
MGRAEAGLATTAPKSRRREADLPAGRYRSDENNTGWAISWNWPLVVFQ